MNSNLGSFKTESQEARYVYLWSYTSMQPMYKRSSRNERTAAGFPQVLRPPHNLVDCDVLFCAIRSKCRQDYNCKATSNEYLPLFLHNFSMYFGNWIQQSTKREYEKLLFTCKIVYRLNTFSF